MIGWRTVLLLGLLVALPALALVEPYDFDTEEQRLRYLEFTRELRCPKCQNQNLADSNAPIAQDLRHELQRLLREGAATPRSSISWWRAMASTCCTSRAWDPGRCCCGRRPR